MAALARKRVLTGVHPGQGGDQLALSPDQGTTQPQGPEGTRQAGQQQGLGLGRIEPREVRLVTLDQPVSPAGTGLGVDGPGRGGYSSTSVCTWPDRRSVSSGARVRCRDWRRGFKGRA